MKNMRILVLAGVLATMLVTSVPAASADGKLINVNTASVAELSEITGIGDAKAKAIVDYRQKSGPFKSVDDLDNVKGIGDKLLAALRPQVTVGAGGDGAAAAAVPAPVAPAAKR